MKIETVWLVFRPTGGVKVFRTKESAEDYAIQYEELYEEPVTVIEKKIL